jgi:autotransporter-associated beta strand protein
MQARAVRTAIVALTFFGIAREAQAQTANPVSIPLSYWNGAEKLAINVSINGGTPQPYIFDTGSPVFNAVYNPSWWPGFVPDPNANNAPSSSLPTNAQLCLGGSTPTFCRGYTGNLVQVPSLGFYKSTSDPTAYSTLSASQGYVVNAAYNYAGTGLPFNSPPLDGYFYGTFGAGDFATNVQVVPNANGRGGTPSGYYAGGVLGQTIVSGVTQGYVVAANGQKNPVSSVNGPQQVNGIDVTIGGQTLQPITDCSPCVTVGLTQQMLGQFWAATPTNAGNAAVIPWAQTGAGTFPNPYGGAVGNNSSKEFGAFYKITLTPPGGTAPVITERVRGMLDSGTPDLTLATSAPASQIAQVASLFSFTGSYTVNAGVTLTIEGAAPGGDAIKGLTTTSEVVTNNGASPITYNGSLTPAAQGQVTNTIGISFFLENSVMYDLTNKVIGYTPFFVTDAPLVTTAGGPLIVDGTNVPLGLAGIVSGPGGITLHSGGKVQFSAVNSYAGLTTIDGGAQLYISGLGSIASSSGVLNNGVFDISRAWSAVAIQDLTGSGDTHLGGQNLIITNAAGTYSGKISDTGAFPGTGGSLTLAGGALILSGANTYSGATNIVAGNLKAGAANAFSPNSTHVVALGAILDLNNSNQTIGSLAGAGNATLGSGVLTAGGNNFSSIFSGAMSGTGGFVKQGTGIQVFSGTNSYDGPTHVNAGALLVNGALTSSSTFVHAGGILGGAGNVRDVNVNGGMFAPGNGAAGSQMTVNGNLGFTGAGIYRVFVDSAMVSSALVNGTATLAGAAVNAQIAAGSRLAQEYTILSTTGGFTGSFGAITTNFPGFQATVVNQGNDAILKLVAALPSAGGVSVNQLNVASTINAFFNSGGQLPPGFLTLFGLTGPALQNALTQLSGEPGASTSSATFLAWQQFFNLVFDPFAENRGGFGGAMPYASEARQTRDNARSAYAAVTPKGMVAKAAPYQPTEPLWRVWGGGYGGSAKTSGNATLASHDTTNRAYGFAVGADRKLTPDSLIGFALAGGGTSFGLSQAHGGGASDMFQVSVYARQNWGAAYLMGAFGYGWQDFTLKRTVMVAGSDNLQADFNANSLAGRAEAGWRFGSPFVGMTPYAAVQIASLDLPAYSERATSGANTFALSYNGRTDTQTRSELGARFDYAMPMRDSILTLRGRAAWAHDHGNDRIANAGFLALPGTAFTVNGATPDANALLVSAGAEQAYQNGFAIAGTFEGEFSGNTESYAGKGSVRYRW